MTAVVFGSTGLIGERVCHFLRLQDIPYLGLSRQGTGAVDFATPATYIGAAGGATTAILLVGHTRPTTPDNSLVNEVESNLRSYAAFVDAAAKTAIRHVVFLSSGGTVYGEQTSEAPMTEDHPCYPKSYYGMGKLMVERMLEMRASALGLKLTILRPSNAMGRAQKFGGTGIFASAVHSAKTGLPLRIWGDGENVRDFVNVDDLARAAVATVTTPPLEAGTRIYNVGSGVGRTMHNVVDLVSSIARRSIEIEYLPASPQDVRRNVLSSAKLTAHTGWKPLVPLAQAVEQMLASAD